MKNPLSVSTSQIDNKKNYVEGEIIIKYKKGQIDLQSTSGKGKANNFINSRSLEKKEDLEKDNLSVLKIKNSTTEQKILELKGDPNIEYVQPNYIYSPSTISTNDSYKDLMWGLDNIGQTVGGVIGTADADMDAPEAWAVNEGNGSTSIVAVIDTGVAYNHPDLIDNMWNGSACRNESDVYLGSCVHGYDYEDGDNDPVPTYSSHGTHVAGIIAAIKNNSKGILGIAPNAKIMALKSGLTTEDNIKSINFAKYNGARIINASWGGTGNDSALRDAIASFPGLFIAAAGNGANYGDTSIGDDHENQIHVYPSDYDLSNVISVAATDQNDTLATFSDYGAISVDIGAPGVSIYSTIAESTILNETFDSLTPPNVPTGWVTSGANMNWGTYQLDEGTYWGVVLYSDANNLPYLDTSPISTAITSPAYNIAGKTNMKIDFWTQCDTEYVADSDYMALDFSSDGTNFTEIMKWNEATIDGNTDPTGGASKHMSNISIPSQYLTSNFKFRFRWVTNGNGNVGGGDGDSCLVDDVKIFGDMDGTSGLYGYMSGTSMATPYVAGLTALIEGYKGGLTDSQVREIILSTGDSLPSLSGKTVTGKRINAKSALDLASHVSISGTVRYYDGVKTVSGATVRLLDDSENQITTTTTDSNGQYAFNEVDRGGNYIIKVEKSENALGVTSLDLLIIQKHLTNVTLITDIYKKIAADINNSRTLTSIDRLAIKRFITGLDTWNANAWKFYSSDTVLDTSNYLTSGLSRSYTSLNTDSANQDFVGIKMGDVNNSWTNN
ncbi:MAG: S8 family serine peptidase [Candidatus Pacebacteria bacterium]|nr:S8 family serine peptidase [Candidatus Paceibacterota bacterium]